MSERLVPELGRLLAAGVPVVLVQVEEAKGSTPREAGAAMLVTAERSFGTIGGGRLEWEGIAHARALLRDGGREARVELPLGPAVGQCCGGHVDLWLRRAAEAERAELEMAEAAAEAALPTVLLFGAGHVGLCRQLNHAFDERRRAKVCNLPAVYAVGLVPRIYRQLSL